MRPHPDTDQLALHALGEPALTPDEQDHVGGCGRCRRTVSELADTVSVVRGPAVDDAVPVPVPAHVWQGIAGELGLDPSVRPASVGPSAVRTARHGAAVPAVAPAGVVGPVAGPAHDAGLLAPSSPARTPDGGASTGGDGPDELQGRRSRRLAPTRLLAVAAAGLVVGAAGTAVVVSLQQDDELPPVAATDVTAEADLLAFGAAEGTSAGGAARLASPDGSGAPADRVLELELQDLPDTGDDFLEAWLIDAETGAMVSLGTVPSPSEGAATAALTVPAGLDVGTFSLVDVSAEPLDGDPTHSGVSLVRGTLGT